MLNWLRKFSRSGRSAANTKAAEQRYELGRSMRSIGELARAVTCFREAIELDPGHLDARIDLASVLLGLGAPDKAEQAARGALALDARSVAAQVNLGAALAGQGKFDDAAQNYRAALALDADCLPALANLGTVCLQLGEVDEARRLAERGLRVAPDDPGAHLRLGDVLMEQREPARAADCYREALRLRPGLAAAHDSLGFACDMQGRLDEAVGCYERALAADPEDVRAHLGRAAIRLVQEDYQRGWDEYEWRLRSAEHAPLYARFPQPRWDGSALAGRRILVQAEQGLGDEILFASCLPDVIAQAAHCVVDCEPRLAGLFRRSFPQASVHGGRQTDPGDWLRDAGPIDLRIPAGSLPLYLRRAPAAFPPHQGYLRADPQRVAFWRDRLQALGPGLKVGLSWRGGVPQTGRGLRSLELAELLPVLRTPGVRFVNLQYGRRGEELAAFRQRHGVEISHWQEAIDDYDDTAALVSALDLTLSVCTALVDLGGALGRPVWVLAPVRSDFRYGIRGEGLRWYPSVRVFRQARCAEWAPVLETVAAELAQRAR